MAESELTDFADDALKFETYEQYLDSQVRAKERKLRLKRKPWQE